MWTPRDLEHLLSHIQSRLDLWDRTLGPQGDPALLSPENPHYSTAVLRHHWRTFMDSARAVPFVSCRELSDRYAGIRDPKRIIAAEHQRVLAEAGVGHVQQIRLSVRMCRQMLARFESRYQCPSHLFYLQHTADLWQGPRDEGATWASLYRTFRVLLAQHAHLPCEII